MGTILRHSPALVDDTLACSASEEQGLLPAAGFYERQKLGRTKQPTLFQQRDGLFAVAGVWESWRSRAGAALETRPIRTAAANDLVRLLPERMPVYGGLRSIIRRALPRTPC